MSDGTKIEWTDATWNVINGCSVTSPGCTNCYAMRLAGTRLRNQPSREGLTIDSKAGPVWNGQVRFNEAVADQPLRWRRPRRIFVCAHGDLFHEDVPEEWIDRVFAVMALAPQHQFQVLTKRPERMHNYLTSPGVGERIYSLANTIAGRREVNDPTVSAANPDCWPLPNVWLGTSVEDQTRADERIPLLLDTPAAVRWLSMEPLLGPVDLHRWTLGFDAGNPAACECGHGHGFTRCPNTGGVSASCHRSECPCTGFRKATRSNGLHWVVAGGESGPNARPMHPAWARSIRDQCAAAGVPFLFKQWGDWAPVSDDADCRFIRRWVTPPDGPRQGPINRATDCLMHRPGKKAAGRLLDGVQHGAFPP